MSKYDITVNCNSKWRHTNFQFNVQDRTKRCLIVICKSLCFRHFVCLFTKK